ncbi:MAG: hypothetical protein ACKN9D_18565, partial [Actinomycetales bacterium]
PAATLLGEQKTGRRPTSDTDGDTDADGDTDSDTDSDGETNSPSDALAAERASGDDEHPVIAITNIKVAEPNKARQPSEPNASTRTPCLT